MLQCAAMARILAPLNAVEMMAITVGDEVHGNSLEPEPAWCYAVPPSATLGKTQRSLPVPASPPDAMHVRLIVRLSITAVAHWQLVVHDLTVHRKTIRAGTYQHVKPQTP